MHDQAIEPPFEDAVCEAERAVIFILLSGEHSPWTRAELEREVAGTRGNPLHVADAIENLYGAGLLNVTRELVTPTRAAARMGVLTG
jgi:hypothetical protein